MACKEREKGRTGEGKKKGEEMVDTSGRNGGRYKIKVDKKSPKKTSGHDKVGDSGFFWKSARYKAHLKRPFNSTVLHSQPIPSFAYFISDEDGWWKSMSLRWAFYQGYAILQTPKTSLSHLCCQNINLSTLSFYNRDRESEFISWNSNDRPGQLAFRAANNDCFH